jgi:transcriptional regulator of NAD metabolism
MNGLERRKRIIELLKGDSRPLSGTYLSKVLAVSRQVIVQDIAILRAEGNDIMATPQGYIIPDYPAKKMAKRVIACIHGSDEIGDELKIIVSMGGRIIDVVVEHPVYGEIKGMLMLSSIYDADEFVRRLKDSVGKPLLVLTKGVHLHTIEADTEAKLDMIEKKLREKGYLLNAEI